MPGALYEHEIGLRSEALEAASTARAASLATGTRWLCAADDLAVNDELRADGSAASAAPGSCGRRRDAGGARLQRLRAPDLAASGVTAALFDMFCGLNGRTLRPRR